jgi:lipoprotein-releasing system permease protein
MSFELYVALRYLLARRRQAFISVISSISTLGVTVGVMALVIALALTTGVQNEMRDRLLGSTAHVYVWKNSGIDDYRGDVERISKVNGVLGVGPTIIGKALIVSEGGQTFINLKGIDPALEPRVTDVERTMQQGSVEALAADDVPGILLGKNLAELLVVKVGDTVNLITPQGTLTPMGMLPRSRPARVVGIYALGLLEFDSQWGFVNLAFAERLVGTIGPELYQVKVADVEAAPEIATRIVDMLGPDYTAQDWQDLNQSLFAALWMEKVLIAITIALIVAVAALQIVASLVLMVMEKSRDIGILKTMGTSPRRISLIFMMQGLVIGVVGTAVGGTLAVALCWVLDTYRLVSIPMDVYQVTHVPFTVVPRDLAIVVIGSIVICFLATIYPSRQAARLDPVEALRFE